MKIVVKVNKEENKLYVNGNLAKWKITDIDDILTKLNNDVCGVDNIDSELKDDIADIAGLNVIDNNYIAKLKSKRKKINTIVFKFKFIKYEKYIKKQEKRIKSLQDLRHNLEISQRYRKMRLRKSEDYFKGNKNTKKMSTEDKVMLFNFYNETKSKVSRDLNIVTKKINYLTSIINLLKLNITPKTKSYYYELLIKTSRIRKIALMLTLAKRYNGVIYIDRNKDIDSYVKHTLNDVKLVK